MKTTGSNLVKFMNNFWSRQVRFGAQRPMSRVLTFGKALIAFVALMLLASSVPSHAGTLPSQSNLAFQTSGRERIPGIGDWYTTKTSSSSDRVHRFVVEVDQAMLDSNGGSVNITITDAESFGAVPDEVTGASDPTRFRLYNPAGTMIGDQTISNPVTNNQSIVFTVSAPGAYVVTSETGAFPIFNDATAGLNDDDNSFKISTPGSSNLIGFYQSTVVHYAGVNQNMTFYFLVAPANPNLFLRNFDVDRPGNASTIQYVKPNNTTIAGTASGDGVWNGTGTQQLNTGGDTVTVNTTTGTLPDVGIWQIKVNDINDGNQFILEANSGNRLAILDVPPTSAGNFRITPDSTIATTVGTPVDHAFSVTNFFFTNDIINLTTANTTANYTVQLRDSNGPLVDNDGDGKVDTGVLTPNQTKNFILRVTPNAGANATDATRINATSLMEARIGAATTTLFVTKTTTLTPSTNVSGFVYSDVNHNAILDGAETGTNVSGLFVKLVPSAGGNAIAATSVNQALGSYQLTGVANGSYNLVLDNNGDDLTDTTPFVPASWIGTEFATGIRPITMAGTSLTNQNFGLYNGSRVDGTVFNDTGVGGGIANNGTRDGTEAGISGVTVRSMAINGTTVYDTAVTSATGAYSVYIPATVVGTVRVVETNPTNYVSTGTSDVSVTTTPPASADTPLASRNYDRTTDIVSFTFASGNTYLGNNFGDVPSSTLTNTGNNTVLPGGTVDYPHVFTPGTAGSVTFSTADVSTPNIPGWSSQIFLDANQNGTIDNGESQVSGAITTTPGTPIYLVVRVTSPDGAVSGNSNVTTLSAQFNYTNALPALSQTLTQTDTTTVQSNINISGFVYSDDNHNGILDAAETGTGVNNLYIKLVPSAGGNAISATAVNPASGSYQFTGVTAGSYNLVLDDNGNDLADTIPAIPSGYIGTEFGSGIRPATVTTSSLINQNFGLFPGSRITGNVFNDNGVGGGTANNGARDGGETGINNVTVRLTNATGTVVYDTTLTEASGNYTLWGRSALNGQSLRIQETNLSGYVSTGGSAGNTGGAYNRAADNTSFTFASGNTYTGANFADVPPNTLTYSGNDITTPGGIAEYPHVFIPGTSGSVTFSVSHLATPNIPGWSSLIYRDLNANGIADSGEPQVTGPITTTPGVAIPLVVRVYAPANAAPGNNDITTLTAQFTYTNASPALSQTLTQLDTTTVQGNSGLQLSKAVSHAQAKKGDVITYTITYTNSSGAPISNIVIYDATPAFTTFVGQSNGALPNNISSISANVTPSGSIAWTLNGSLLPSQSGTVSFQVQLQ